MTQAKALAVLALGVSIGLTFLVLGCALDNSWWPLMELIAFAIVPLPAILCPPNNMSMGANPMQLVGNFVNGFVLVSVFALPWVQLHISAISTTSAIFVTLSNLLLIASGVAYGIMSSKDDM